MVNAFRLPGVAARATPVALVATALSACSPDGADPVATGTIVSLAEQRVDAAETDTLDATLVVGDQRVPVGSPTADAGPSDGATTRPTFAVAVPADGALSLDVDVDGVSQTLDLETGAQTSLTATALTGLPDAQPAGTDCGGQ